MTVLVRSESCRTKVPRIFRILVPDFAPDFAPNFPEFYEDFSCFVSWETETRKNSPEIPAIFQCKILRPIRKNIHKSFCRAGKVSFGGFDGFGGSGEHLAPLCLSYKIPNRVDGFGGHGGFSHDAYPPQTPPPLKFP